MQLRRPGLILHTFLLADPAPDETVRTLWAAVAKLGLDAPIGRWPKEAPAASRGRLDRPFEVMAGRQDPDASAVHQAILYRVHDVIGLSVQLAPNDERIGWDLLLARWTTQVPKPPAEVLATVTVHTALVPAHRRWSGGPRRLTPAALVRQLARSVPDPVTEWADAWCRTDQGVVTWELPSDETTGGRRLLAATGTENETSMDDWTWTGSRSGLPPLTRYLLHAAKVRHQHRVLDASMPDIRATIARAERGAHILDDLLRDDEPPLSQLLAADRVLGAAQADQSGLITALSDVRDTIRTVQVAEKNMAAALDGTVRSTPGGPPALDREHAAWLIEQLRTQQTYLDSAHRRTAEISRLAGAAIEQRQRQRQESLTLAQTSVLGALLMTLAAIQSLVYKVRLPGPLFAPVIVVLAVVALLLPPVLLRRPDGPRHRVLKAAGGAVTGAAFGWLAVSVGFLAVKSQPAPGGWSAGIAAAAAVVVAVATMAAPGRHSQGQD